MNTTDVASEDSEPDQRGSRQTPDAPRFIVAHGCKGGWVVNDRLGLVGGIFITEAAARHFAIEESGHHPEEVLLSRVDAEIEFPRSKAA